MRLGGLWLLPGHGPAWPKAVWPGHGPPPPTPQDQMKQAAEGLRPCLSPSRAGAPRRLPSQRSNQILNTVSKLKPVPYLKRRVPSREQPSSSSGTLPGQLCLGARLGASGPMPHGGQEKGRHTGTVAGTEAHGFSPPFCYSFPLIFISPLLIVLVKLNRQSEFLLYHQYNLQLISRLGGHRKPYSSSSGFINSRDSRCQA